MLQKKSSPFKWEMLLAPCLQTNHLDNKHYNVCNSVSFLFYNLLQWLAAAVPRFYHVVLLFRITDYLLWFITAKVFDALKLWNTDLDTFKWIQQMHCLSLCGTKGESYSWHRILSCWSFAKEKLATVMLFFIKHTH